MQIFALFMLCGTLVSFLVPETKGRTLEELAGETTSQLDRRKSSLTPPTSFLLRHNPFRGGRPAGFSWNRSPNLLPRSPGIIGKRERVGIMTSPELLPKRGAKHGRTASETSTAGEGTVSVSSAGRATVEPPDDDLYIQGSIAGTLPGWGAGWVVERNAGQRDGLGRVQSIQLHDFGKLLK
jgi:PHS family inorganic phosphate transporter-like MFS transporter